MISLMENESRSRFKWRSEAYEKNPKNMMTNTSKIITEN